MAVPADRRRVNGPAKTQPAPVVARRELHAPGRTRAADELRKIFLKTGLTPSAAGSAYLESSPSQTLPLSTSPGPRAGLKLSCVVHGPRPLPRSAAFSPQLVLSARIKYAPFATSLRKGYVPDAHERDLAGHLESALRGVVIGDRWPKSGVDVVITVLETEETTSGNAGDELSDLIILANCITVASAALTQAGIDCVDLITGGVAALVADKNGTPRIVLDPCPADGELVLGACLVGYLDTREEVTEMWFRSGSRANPESETTMQLLDAAIKAATAARPLLISTLAIG